MLPGESNTGIHFSEPSTLIRFSMAASIPKSRSALRNLPGMLSTLLIICSRTAGETEQGRLFPKGCSSTDSRWVKQDACRHTGFVSPWRLHRRWSGAAAQLGWVCLVGLWELEFHGIKSNAGQNQGLAAQEQSLKWLRLPFSGTLGRRSRTGVVVPSSSRWIFQTMISSNLHQERQFRLTRCCLLRFLQSRKCSSHKAQPRALQQN